MGESGVAVLMTQTTDTEIRDLILGLDKKIDALDKKLEITAARTDERLKALETQVVDYKKNTDTQLTDIKLQLRSQDNRLWGFLAALFLAVLGFAAKLLLFPTGQA